MERHTIRDGQTKHYGGGGSQSREKLGKISYLGGKARKSKRELVLIKMRGKENQALQTW